MRSTAALLATFMALAGLTACTDEPDAMPRYEVQSRADYGLEHRLDVVVENDHRLEDVFDEVIDANHATEGYSTVTIYCGPGGPNAGKTLAIGSMAWDLRGAKITGLLSEGMYEFDRNPGTACP